MHWADDHNLDIPLYTRSTTIAVYTIQNNGAWYDFRYGEWLLSKELLAWLDLHKNEQNSVHRIASCYDTIQISNEILVLFKLTWL